MKRELIESIQYRGAMYDPSLAVRNYPVVSLSVSERDELCALALRATDPKSCRWEQVGHGSEWESECGLYWVFPDVGPEESDMRFCPSCGGLACFIEEDQT